MKAIKVLGTGCANCRATTQRVEQVAKELGVAITLEKVEAIQDIMSYGILATPGVVVDGKVVHSGGVPTPREDRTMANDRRCREERRAGRWMLRRRSSYPVLRLN